MRLFLFQWDPFTQYKSILVLDGGYENYILMYPMDATNAHVRPSSGASKETLDNGQLDDIEYPNISDITMKDQSLGGSSNQGTLVGQPQSRPGLPPTIDRSSKLAALKSYNSRQELLKEQHEIAERLLASQKECLNEEIELAERIRSEAKRQVDAVTVPEEQQNKEEQEDKINESRFRIMQLDNSIEDTMMKKQLVEETKAVVPEQDSREAQDNMRIMASIRQKELEIQEIKAQRDRIAREREEKLRLAKEQKKNLINKANAVNNKPPPSTGHVASHPVVDRSVKPILPVVIADFEDNVQRDFAPVFGKVVSTVVEW